MKRASTMFLALIMCLLVVGCSEDNPNAVAVPSSARGYRGENYKEVVDELKSVGFVNFQTEAIEDLVTGWMTKDKEIDEIYIDGNASFEEGDKFDRNALVKIIYHTFPNNDESEHSKTTKTPKESASIENFRTETEKWLASDDYNECMEKGKFPVVPGNNPYGSGINESKRNKGIYYLDYSRQGPWGKESGFGDFEYYVPSGKYLVMNATNPKQYGHVPTGCNVYVCNPNNDDDWETYSFTKYGDTQEITIPEGYYVALTVSATVTLEPLTE